MVYRNPFKPTAGKMPPVLVGREKVVDDFIEGLSNGTGAPGRLMRITGPRGSGKTVLLSELASIAQNQGWLVINVAAGDDLLASVKRKLEASPVSNEVEVKASVPFMSVNMHRQHDNGQDDLESLLETVTHRMTAKGKGLLITIDEAQDASHEDIRQIASAVQFMIRDELDIALVFAGITTGVLDILNGKAMTFLRRAKAEELDAIPLDEVSAALRETIVKSGFQIEDQALHKATEATAGYAYLIQLVGYHVWRQAWLRGREGEGEIVVSLSDAERGIAEAMAEFKNAVLETAISGLPKMAIKIALEMSSRGKVVSMSDIATALGKTTGYLSPYRRQLIAHQIIEPTAPGYLTFSIPFMREYLRENRDEILARYGE